jgi:hypothetical protein
LIVNKVRYKAEGYTERYLQGGDCVVAYDPKDASTIWIVEKGSYTPFSLILSEFEGMSLGEIDALQSKKKALVRGEEENNTKARIALMESIEAIANAPRIGETNG